MEFHWYVVLLILILILSTYYTFRQRKKIKQFQHPKLNEFQRAIENVDTEKIKQMVSEDQQLINSPNAQGITPLIFAMYKTQGPDIVNLLISLGADVNQVLKNQETPLIRAIHKGNVLIMNALIQKGADINYLNGVSFYSALISTYLMLQVQFQKRTKCPYTSWSQVRYSVQKSICLHLKINRSRVLRYLLQAYFQINSLE